MRGGKIRTVHTQQGVGKRTARDPENKGSKREGASKIQEGSTRSGGCEEEDGREEYRAQKAHK